MDPINIALWLILIATIALVPCGCPPPLLTTGPV
jgi:hypothetical protein